MPRHPVAGVITALAAGVLGAAAYPPLALWPCKLVSLGVLLWLLTHSRHRPWPLALALGLAYGLGFMGVLIWWMNAVSLGAYIALVAVQALSYGLVAIALRLVLALPVWPLWAAGVWVGFEALRGSQPFSGFPWGRLAHVTAETVLMPWVRYLASPGTTAALFAAIALTVWLITAPRLRTAAVTGGLIVILLAGGAALPTGPAEPGDEIPIAVVQGDVPGPVGTWRPGQLFGLHVDATRQLAQDIAAGRRERPAFVLWPETALNSDPWSTPGAEATLSQLERDLGAPILVGALLDGPTPTTAYNAGIVWEGGTETGRYVKRNLVPYGEYVPFRQVLGNLVPRFDREIPRDMLPGDTVGLLSIGGVRVGDAICWDIAYDDAVRDTIVDGAELLVVQTSNASFTGTAQPDQQWLISKLRAVETGRDLAVASTNGLSGIVDADGRTRLTLPKERSGIMTTQVRLAEGMTPAVRFGPSVAVMWYLVGVTGLVWASGRERHRYARGRDRADVQ